MNYLYNGPPTVHPVTGEPLAAGAQLELDPASPFIQNGLYLGYVTPLTPAPIPVIKKKEGE